MYDYKFLIFGGTTEGRMITEFLCDKNVELHVSVVTEYGEKLLPIRDNVVIKTEPLDEEQIYSLLMKEDYDMVIDATHPYATAVTANIVSACIRGRVEFTRLIRAKSGLPLGGNVYYVESHEEAIKQLNRLEGNIFLTTGSKELKTYYHGVEDHDRIYARVLPSPEVFDLCQEIGMPGSHLICMQGPFSKALNQAMFHEVEAAILVTKEAGTAGGFEEKIEAARKAQMITIVIGRQPEENGLPFEAVKVMLKERYFQGEKEEVKEISLIGIGMGNPKQLTYEAKEALMRSQVLIGSRRVVDTLKEYRKPVFYSFKNEEILEFLLKNPQYERVSLIFSGDIGFYSGAKEVLSALKGWKIETYCGIPTIAYLSSKLHMSWEGIKLVSLHGRDGKIAIQVQQNAKVFALLGGQDSVNNLCKDLINHGLAKVKLYVGERLSYENERITEGLPGELMREEFDPLASVIIENPCPVSLSAQGIVTHGLADEVFLRSDVPMTKREIRSITLSKMELYRNSIIYDIGAGTGSITIESAIQSYKGHVYSIEKELKATALIEENIKKFALSNVTVIKGQAPEAMEKLEMPTHAFIGGTSGKIKHILDILFNKNPKIRIVINAISLETLAEIMKYIEFAPNLETEIIQVSVSKARVLGRYHMMNGENPIYVMTMFRT